jgi:hypothetical protein
MTDFGRIVFVGNCQIGAMWRIYQRTLPEDCARLPVFIESYNAASNNNRHLIANAEIVVWQTTEFTQAVGDIETRGKRVFVPMVICPFLWPYGGTPHPGNESSDALPGGPYPGEFGDAFLNQYVGRDVPATEAARIYRDHDVAKGKNVVRMAEITLDQQRRRDRACGDYDVAGMIERLLPSEPLFRSRGHLNPPIMRHLAQTLYGQLGADPAFMEYLATTRYDDLVPFSELPIHPSIARQFGMTYIDDRTRYEFFVEGAYTFLEWAERYVRYEWNEAFNQAMYLARSGDLVQAIPMWEESMNVSLRSVSGRVNLAEVMVRNGMTRRAVRWIREGLALEPANPTYLRRAGEIQNEAEWLMARERR